nr:reverse transcriptase domain-containing protein [Tanacetum cinerariifolium]
MIHRMYVDGGSSMEILYEHCFNRLRPEVKNQMVPATTSLTSFSGETIWPLGQLRFLVTIGDVDHSTRAWMNFMIVRSLSPYNGIIRRLGIKEIQAVPSTAHGMLKFPVDGGIVTIHSTSLIPVECAMMITSSEVPKETGVCHINFKVALHPNFSDQEVAIGRTFSAKGRTELCSLLKENLDIFAWKPPVGRIVIPFQKSTGKSNFSAATLSSVSWTLTKAITRLTESDEEKTTFHTGQGDDYNNVMLGEYNITYRPRTLVKGQTLFTDGSSCVDGFGVGLILTSPEGTEFTYALRFQFAASNNDVEYEALIAGLWIAAQMGVRNIHVSVDSKLVANQVLGAYVAEEENMIKYLEKVKSLVSGFTNFSINQVPRSKNKKADALSKIASTSFVHLSKQVLVEILKEKSIQEKEVTTMVEEDGPTWMASIMEYLKEVTLPSDRKEARNLRIKARQYELLEVVLYRRSFLTLWLRTTVSGGQIHTAGILLANDALGRVRYYTYMQQPSSTSSRNKKPPAAFNPDHGSVAILQGKESRLAWARETRIGLKNFSMSFGPMIKSSHGDTPFSLTYGTKAVIPAEIRMPTYRTAAVDVVHNNEELRLNLDLLEERHKRAAICEAKAKLQMTKYYNARSAALLSGQVTLSTAVMTLVMLWRERS